MNTIEHIYFEDATKFRTWLKKNHDKSVGIWMIYYKKHTNKKCIVYSDALDEAICYGWIDSLVKRIDDDTYVRKFTPRKNIDNWSDVNKLKVKSLIAKNKMTKAGMKKISASVLNEIKNENIQPENQQNSILKIPDYILNALTYSKVVQQNFNKLSISQKLKFVRWIDSAKKQDTRNNRLKQTIELLSEGRKLGLK